MKLQLLARSVAAALVATAIAAAQAGDISPLPAASAAAQAEAVRRYPALGVAASAFHREFFARARQYRVANSALFQNVQWPVVLADEIAAAGLNPYDSANEGSGSATPRELFAASKPAQIEAMLRHPELAKQGSAFHGEFIARVQRRLAQDSAFFKDDRWPLALAEEVVAAGFPSMGKPGRVDSQATASRGTPLSSAPEWRFLRTYREGSDLVVPHAIATVFGWDPKLRVRDPNDNGKCASGCHTRDNPGILGCALPVSSARRSTLGSPFARISGLPWFSPVVVTYKGRSVLVQLIDNGPSAPAVNDLVPAGIDLTPAACLALGISLEDIRRNKLAIPVSFRLLGAGRLTAQN